MKKHEKEVTQAELDAEKKVLRDLEKQYQTALKDIDDKVAQLLGRSDADMPNVIYQVQHQKALRSQIHGILEQLQANEFQTVSDYLTASYQQSFVGTMYSIHNQGIPVILPIDQNAMVKAVTTNSRLSEDLYTSLGVDIKKLNNSIRAEISRGISAGLSYNEIARNIANASKAPKSRAATIVRTESHRIREESRNDARDMAKKKGADVVKQWDATLDGDTRKSHRKLDGQIREVDEPFEVDGKKAMYPGDFGRPEEDINCRCISLTRARWELDEAELETLKKRAEFFGIDKTADFEDYQNKYLKASANIEKSLENTEFYGKIVLKDSISFSASGKPYEIPLSRAKKKEIIARGIGEATPVFAVDTAKNKFATYVRSVKPEEGFFDVALHGRDTSIEFFGENIDAYTLAQIIRQRKDYVKGTPIRLLSCNTGNVTNTGDCVAQIVANELGVIVTAPTDVLYAHPDGTITIGKRNEGEMKKFYPRK